MSGDNSSTIKSYVDSAVAGAQSVVSSITGNPADKSQAESTKDKAAFEKDASHSVGKLGPISVTPQGGIATDSPDRSAGSWNQTVGSAKESLGGLVGAEGLKREGQQQNAEGKGQEAQGQLSDYGHGIQDRAKGALGGIGAAVMGDREKQEKAQQRHDDGKAAQRGVEADLTK